MPPVHFLARTFYGMKNAFFLFLIALFAASLAIPQTVTKSAAKPASKKGASKSAKKGSKKSAKTTAAWHSRQMTPTPERYREIQQALADKGYLKSEPNGVWDAQSVEALKQFQTDKNLSPTGKISSASLIDLGLGPKSDSPQPGETPAVQNPAN
jgi:peptidoglycan hydrolase-like protein with peptidoglycan-binding domain